MPPLTRVRLVGVRGLARLISSDGAAYSNTLGDDAQLCSGRPRDVDKLMSKAIPRLLSREEGDCKIIQPTACSAQEPGSSEACSR